MKQLTYDVLIIGGGFAGSTAAWHLANKGLRILLIDSKPWNRIGDKPCGDAVSKEHFDNLGMPYPEGEQLEQKIDGIKLYSPDMSTEWTVKGEGFEINAPAYTQRILKEARDRGVEVMDLTTAMKPVLENGFVKGAVIFDRRKEEQIEVKAKMVIEATGYSRSFRSKLPQEIPVSEDMDERDADIAYREVAYTREDIDEPGYLKIFINQTTSPGGYWWYFPKGKDKVNIGLGIQGGMGYPSIYTFYEKYWKEYGADVDRNRMIVKGGALVPTRRPLDTLVWNGIIVIGDSGYTANPVHGGGKGSAMISGFCAARATLNSFEKGDFSAQSLWETNLCYNERYGAKQASLELFRRFLQKLSDDDINYGMRKKVIREEDLLEASMTGDLQLSVADKAMRVIAGLGRPSLLYKLKNVAEYMKEIKALYRAYPAGPDQLPKWKGQVKQLILEFDKVISK
ncbi:MULTISPECIES: digeranylgeranylglycerophospholipid reductase [Metallosphaera]|uniref:digeranylgeranylglycerophospholipid reductase n=1 Tax=Metallosphaera TaxID=41980 RepID=UPI001F060CD4|nr:digeranylgeranylglycerophospholipid reductase [Metallosphaera sedula]MCH1771679.1 NAD(P)/FAD-dependent oxidoreductase [Metallosphaera sedula]MCP6728278.1 NAD(P)/FAD-dependent oxidoreductase [Metallosphaera sedula]